jgi:acyl-CoA synthetase (NDP forming)
LAKNPAQFTDLAMQKRQDSISTLLAPRSIALVGASDDVTRIGGRPLRYLRESGYQGVIYPVNPNRETVQGVKSYKSVQDLPEAPDVAVLAVPANGTLAAVRECAERGIKAATIFSAGFAETGDAGRSIQDEMTEVAAKSGMRLLGPNCLGVFNSKIGYYGTFSAILDGALIEPGPVAVISQSGAYGSHIAHLARQRGLGISYWVTTGNETDIDVAEALRWAVEQPDVNVVMAYAEGIRDSKTFIEALEVARKRETAIVLMKVGRSEVGAHAVSSHTAALAGSDAVFDAVFRQFGVWRAKTTAEQLDIAYACSRGRYPKSNRLGIFTLSGGFGIQMADDAQEAGLDVAPMPDAAQDELKAMLPYASPRNPVDATAQALTDLPLMTRYMSTMLEKGDYDFFTGIFGAGPASPSFAGKLRDALEAASGASKGTILSLTMSAPRDIVRTYEEKGFLVHEDGSALMTALGALVHFRNSFDRPDGQPAPTDARPISFDKVNLSEYEAKRILSAAGVPFPEEVLCGQHDDVGIAAARVGFPVVLKISSRDIAHKTEIGGVVVGVKSEQEARIAATAILERARKAQPTAQIDGILVAPMIGEGLEVIAGVARDPVFGPVVMFGLGGIFVEVLKDVTFRAAPFGVDEAKRMIREIRGRSMFDGVRGKGPTNIEPLAKILSSLSVFAATNADSIESIDLNPIRLLEDGARPVALDALIVPRISSS